jgi:hypothetical protein
LLQPNVNFLFECELPADVEPKPFDDEVEWYQFCGILSRSRRGGGAEDGEV